MTMADRIVVMNHGQIQQVGAPLDLYDRPANKFVAGFIGSPSMSFISGALNAAGAVTCFETAEGVRLPMPRRDAPPASAVEAGIRPEHFVIGEQGMSIKVDVVEPTGSETHVYGSIGGDPVRAVFRQRIQVKPGDRLPVTVAPENIHLFDTSTGLPV
jgi:multiple sugar transport system ATP-binding protein